MQELKIREVDTRIETEIAGLRTAIETAKVRKSRVLSPRTWLIEDMQQSTLQYLVTVGAFMGLSRTIFTVILKVMHPQPQGAPLSSWRTSASAFD